MMLTPPPLPSKHKGLKVILVILLVLVAIGSVTYSLLQSGLLFQSEPVADIPLPLEPEPLPPVNIAEMLERAKERAYAELVVAQTRAEYEKRHAPGSPGFEEGLVAAQLLAYYLVEGDFFGEGRLQTADFYAKTAYRKGSRDPMVLATRDLIMYRHRHSSDLECLESHFARIREMEASGYPALCKLAAGMTGLQDMMSMNGKKYPKIAGTVRERCGVAVGMVVEELRALAQTDVPRVALACEAMAVSDLIDEYALQERAGSQIDEILVSAKVPEPDLALFRGGVLINMAWAARGSGWGNTVTKEGWRLMALRLTEAEEVLNRASNEFPEDARIPAMMIQVELGQGKGRYRMEIWFDKAVQANPKEYCAYSNRMYYLQPRWYGSPRDIVEFGRKCVATGYWDKKIPMVLVNGVCVMAEIAEEVYADEEIWRLVYETSKEFLERYPQSVYFRTKLLQYAVNAKKWDVAREQMNILGRLWDREIFDEKEYRELKARVEAKG